MGHPQVSSLLSTLAWATRPNRNDESDRARVARSESIRRAPYTCQRKAIMGHQPRDMWATGPQPGWLAPHNCKRQAIVGYPAYHNFVKRR